MAALPDTVLLRQEDVQALVAAWLPVLAPGWSAVVNFDADLSGTRAPFPARAAVDLNPRCRMAVLLLAPGWDAGWPDTRAPGRAIAEEVESAIVHELLHLTFSGLDHAFGLAANRLGDEARAMAREAYIEAQEALVEHLADTLVERDREARG